MKIKQLVTSVFLFTTALSATANEELASWEKLLMEKNRDYPGCVFIVRDEVQNIDEDKLNVTVPVLLDTCIKGREIGEKTTREMYGINPEKDQPRKKSFSIRLVPLDEMKNEQTIFYKDIVK